MSTSQSVSEWRERWQSNQPFAPRPPQPPKSPWVYMLAAFGGTVLAICSCLVIGTGILVAIGASHHEPSTLTYVNDTDEDLWLYECLDRCDDYESSFPLDAGETDSWELRWYYENQVDWVIVIHDDGHYGCIEIPEWTGQTILLSGERSCPADIHSPESSSA